ncbi:MAG: CDP-diacylglycerol--glycerol-3-phosphate 3-phosphatidyltransferase [Myxococcales bacterium]|nr:CDP-diacylglycerol--glycerol-3-phosphate 3-phosphatidyltransferase [Myxococcales bacterium]MCB9719126.1 CDP-diacylglycerol--glycerol-3-phosphate 3-phosphatidyltransferase [Myxococcales bacterium]
MSRYDSLKREILNLPNLITIGRLFLIPPVLLLIDPTDPIRNFIAALLFAAASGLDILDGWLARRNNLVTVFGQFVDPLADKLMAMSVMIALVDVGLLPAWLVILMLGRDFYISGLRSVAASMGVVIAAGFGGKKKTVFQLMGLCCVMARYPYRMPLTDQTMDFLFIGLVFLYVSLLLSFGSAIQYTFGFRDTLRAQRETPAAGEGD